MEQYIYNNSTTMELESVRLHFNKTLGTQCKLDDAVRNLITFHPPSNPIIGIASSSPIIFLPEMSLVAGVTWMRQGQNPSLQSSCG
jgi:hypothetical protein